jgi:peptide/nickel transport system substrate-binding protein
MPAPRAVGRTESGGMRMKLIGQRSSGLKRRDDRSGRRPHRLRRSGRVVLFLGTAGVLVTPLAQALSTGGPAGAASSNVDPNGVLKYGFDLNNEFDNDFAPATEENDCSYTVTSNIYQSMAQPGNTAIMGGVAQSWSISNNSSTITFHIRPGLEFSNGQPVTSADVAASLNHTKTSPLRSSLFAISSIQTPDPSTVVVNLSKPTAGDFLWASTYIDGQIYPASAISTQSTQPVGAGPYVLKSYRQGSSIVLAKNPKYWDSKAYPLGSVDFTQVTQGPEAATALTSGAVDMIEVEPQNYPQLKGDPNIGISTTKSYDFMEIELRQNTGPFANEKVRSALEYAVDRAALNKVVFDGLGQPAYQPVPTWSPGYSKSLGSSDAYSPSKAKAMLKAAGYPKGVKFTLIIPSGDATYARAAALLQSELASAGFTANLQQIPGADFLTDVYIKKQGDAVLSEQLSNGPDLSNSFEALFESSGFVANALGSVNPQLSPLIQQANASLSASLQGPLMQQIDKTVIQQGLLVPLVFMPSIVAYNKNRVGGHVVAPIGQCRSDLAGIYIKK